MLPKVIWEEASLPLTAEIGLACFMRNTH